MNLIDEAVLQSSEGRFVFMHACLRLKKKKKVNENVK